MAPTASRPGRLSPEESLVASLIQLMEAGTAPWRRDWDSTGGGHHLNLISGRPYRGSNPVLLTPRHAPARLQPALVVRLR